MTIPEIILEVQALETNCHLIGHLGTLNGFQHEVFKSLYEDLNAHKDSICEIYLGDARMKDSAAMIPFPKGSSIVLANSVSEVMNKLRTMSDKLPSLQKECASDLVMQNELIELQKTIKGKYYLLTLNK